MCIAWSSRMLCSVTEQHHRFVLCAVGGAGDRSDRSSAAGDAATGTERFGASPRSSLPGSSELVPGKGYHPACEPPHCRD